jgi:hypothetical protein
MPPAMMQLRPEQESVIFLIMPPSIFDEMMEPKLAQTPLTYELTPDDWAKTSLKLVAEI